MRAAPDLRSVDDLAGGSLGVQHGNTSEPVAQRLQAEGKLGQGQDLRLPRHPVALDDLEAGRLDAFMKLEPVMRWLIRDRPYLARRPGTGITDERAGGRGSARQHGPGRGDQRRAATTGRQGRPGASWDAGGWAKTASGTEVLGMIRLRPPVHRRGWSVAGRGRRAAMASAGRGERSASRNAAARMIHFAEFAAGSQSRLAQRSAPSLRHHSVRNGRVRDSPRRHIHDWSGRHIAGRGRDRRWPPLAASRRPALAPGLRRCPGSSEGHGLY